MSLSDIDLASLIDIYSRDDCVAVFRSQVAECLRELQSLRAALRQFADCDLNEGNCASLEIATRRIRSVARAALPEKHAKEDGHEPEW
jgi:hypothetical protein